MTRDGRPWWVLDRRTGCWVGQLSRTRRGYIRLKCDGRTDYLHRWSYRTFVGPIPPGFDVDHVCAQRACCNPAHLKAVTHRENLLADDTIVAAHARKRRCLHGHPFTPENTIRRRDGNRDCRACHNARRRARRRERVA